MPNDAGSSVRPCPICGGILNSEDHIHRQVPLMGEYGVHAHVDEGIAELLALCWRLGIWTHDSCEGDPQTGRAYISFAPDSGERFVGAATIEDLDDPSTFESLGWRMRGADTEDDWEWHPGGFPWGVRFSAHFPPSDIPELVRRFRRFW